MTRPLRTLPIPTRRGALGGAAAVVLALAGCGGGGQSSATTASTATQAATTTSTTPPGSAAPVATSGPVRGTLHGANHAPKVNRPWRYTVTTSDAAGHPLAGTVDIEFTYGGAVVGRDTPATHPLKNGRWSDTITFPAAAVGQPLTFQAVVHTRLGSITLGWPITVAQ